MTVTGHDEAAAAASPAPGSVRRTPSRMAREFRVGGVDDGQGPRRPVAPGRLAIVAVADPSLHVVREAVGAGAGRGPDAARRPHVGAAARRAARPWPTSSPGATACWPAPRAPPRRSPSSTPAVKVTWAAADGDAVAAGDRHRHGVRADGVDPHGRADGAELPVPPVGGRHITQRFADAAAAGGPARIWDTRKTTPGLRTLREGRGAGRGRREPPGQPVRLGDVQGQPPRGARDRRGRRVGQGHLARPARARRGHRPRASSPRRSRPAPTPCCSTT